MMTRAFSLTERRAFASSREVQDYCAARTFEERAFSPLSYFRNHAYPIPALSRSKILPRSHASTRSGTWRTILRTLTSHADGRSRIHGFLPLLRALGEQKLCRRS
jgi:hypothetical protein